MAEDEAARSEHRPRLGRGLAALLGDASDEAAPRKAARRAARRRSSSCAPIRATRASVSTTRELDELAASIKERGIIQPVAGARHSRASRTPMKSSPASGAGGRRSGPGLHEIPILVIEAGDREALEIAIVENVQRADLNALEEAAGYAQLGADHGYSHADIARVVGKSRSHVANTLRLLQSARTQRARLLAGGQISAGHARALLAVADPDAIADRIVAEGLTVRDVERLGENAGKTSTPRAREPAPVDADTLAFRKNSALALGTQSDDPPQRRERRHPHRLPAISSSSTISAAGFASPRRR